MATPSDLQDLFKDFPRLAGEKFEIICPASESYNCIAYALEILDSRGATKRKITGQHKSQEVRLLQDSKTCLGGWDLRNATVPDWKQATKR